MKRLVAGFASTLLLASVVAVPRLLADVKTTQKVTFKLAGVLGMFVNRMAGGAKTASRRASRSKALASSARASRPARSSISASRRSTRST